MLFDCHMHTEFSSDSIMKLEDALLVAKENNIGITITEHCDFILPDPDIFRLDAINYFKTYSHLKKENLLLGVEIGMSQNIVDKNNEFTSSHPFDFVIGSMHSVLDDDIYTVYRKKSITKNEFFKLYFEDIYKCITLGTDFDALGHIDYPCRYMPFEDKELYYNEFSEEIDKVLSALIERGKVLELNTARLDNKTSYNNLKEIYGRYKQLGGEFITIGSDAHIKTHIARNFDKALEFCNEVMLSPVYFKNRKLTKADI